MQVHLFISDLHLSSQRPATTALFLRFLRERAVPATALYILGDLFDAWVGDDDERPPIPEIVTAMKALSDVGTTLYFMPGNRDFLIGERFIRASGCRPLPDPYILAQPDKRILLMHGDLLCSDDRDYQAWRQRLRNPAFIEQLLARPIAERIAIDSYREMIDYLGTDDSTTRRMLEGILAMEEEHADDLAGMLAELGRT